MHSFEWSIWQSRMMVVVAVIASIVASAAMFVVTAMDTALLLVHIPDYLDFTLAHEARHEIRTSVVAQVVSLVDGYLFASIMLIFGLGIYELFIGKIKILEESQIGSRLLAVESLDDLKGKLGKVVLLILVVKFFEYALKLHYHSPLELLYLASGTVLVSLALYLSHK